MKNIINRLITMLLSAILIISIMPIEASAANASADIPDGIYFIGTKKGNRVDIKGAGTTNGTIAHVWAKADNDNQAFAFTRLPDGTYRITAYHSGLSLEVSNSSKDDGGRVQQWEFLDNYDCKRWYIYDCGSGWYKIVNKNSGKCLDIKGNKDESVTVIQQYKDNGTSAQRFSLTKLEYSPQNYNRYKVGDKIYVDGYYYASSSGNGNCGRWPQQYVVAMVSYNAKYPYAIRPVNGKNIYGWINESSISIPDYTDAILYGVLPELQKIKTSFDYFSTVSALCDFYEAFKTGGALDIKNEDRWNDLFSVSYPGIERFIFLDMTITADQLGNILYGWFGTLLGINDIMLYWGGGFAHQKNITGYNFGKTLALDCLYDPFQHYGDTPEDHFDVMRGILLAGYRDEYLLEMSIDTDAKVIQASGKILNIAQTSSKVINQFLNSICMLSI